MSIVKQALGPGLKRLYGDPTNPRTSSHDINRMYDANSGLGNIARGANNPVTRERAKSALGKMGKLLDSQRESAKSVGLPGSRFSKASEMSPAEVWRHRYWKVTGTKDGKPVMVPRKRDPKLGAPSQAEIEAWKSENQSAANTPKQASTNKYLRKFKATGKDSYFAKAQAATLDGNNRQQKKAPQKYKLSWEN